MKRIYFDNNSSCVIDNNVIAFIEHLLPLGPYNPSSIHEDGRKARILLETARNQIAKALNIDLNKDNYQIIFTSSGTEANNLAICNFKHLSMIAGATEHVSILEADHPNIKLINVDKNGIIDEQDFQEKLKDAKFVSIMLANNETGVLQDIKTLTNIAHQHGAIMHCDASQAFGKIEVNLKSLNCDMMTISSHKFGGPLGAAALIIRKDLALKSIIKGGKQEQGMRAGTENVIAIAGFGLAAENNAERIKLASQCNILRDYLEDEILKFSPKTEIFGRNISRLPNTSCITMPGVKNEQQLITFDLAGISLSAGSACSSGRISASHVLIAMGAANPSEAIRVSLSLNNTKEEVDKFISIWKDIKGKNL